MTRTCIRIGAAVALAFFAWTPGPAGAGEVRVPHGATSISVKSMREMRFTAVVQQRHDFSCGAAALATLLTYHYGTETTEVQLVDAMMAAGDPERIRREGFSMADMQRFLAAYGVRSNGYWASLDDLRSAAIPVISLIDVKGYRHFVVIKGIAGDQVLVGDPVLGLKTYRIAEFEKIKVGPLFAIDDHQDMGQDSFNAPNQWAVQPKSAVMTARWRDSIALSSVLLRSPSEF
ncbi:MAG TPA: C39 family peptidase [Azospirillum sp.]|nr:C39 family peptidase [Azospirillum sp.]